MLDVMKNPPPVIEQITWTASRTKLPDDGTTVLMFNPFDEDDGVWMGWYDSATDTWLDVHGEAMHGITWWANKPAGPSEPKPGQVQDVRPLVQCTMEHVTSMVNGSDGMPSQVRQPQLAMIVRILLKGLGMQALGGRNLCIDLANGHSLMVQVKEGGEVPA